MKLMRSRYNKFALGVCSGIADHFGWSRNFVRLAFIAFAPVSFGTVIGIYVFLAFVLPEEY